MRTRDEALALASGILAKAAAVSDSAEVFFVESANTPVHFEANAIKGVDANDGAGAALRLIKDGRVGFSSTSNLGDIDGLVEAALETAPFGAEARFTFPGPSAYPDVPTEDASALEATLEEMTALGQRAIDEIRAFSDEAQVEGGVSRSQSTIALVNTSGVANAYGHTRFRIGFEGTVIHGEDMLFTFDGESSIARISDPSRVVGNITRQLGWAKETVPIEPGTMPVVLLPTAVASVLLSPLLAGLSGKSVYQGTSPLVDRLGERIVDERFSVADDATLARVPASRPMDDEGVVSRRLPLIENGVAANFFYDLQTAGLAGKASTGSGERGLGSLPSPSTGVLVVGEGDATLEEILAHVGDGLIVEQLLGAGQGNILGGDFNANVLLGYKIEGGKVAGRVKNVMVAGNAYRALNELIAIGSEGRWLGGGLYAPPIAIGGVSVSAQG